MARINKAKDYLINLRESRDKTIEMSRRRGQKTKEEIKEQVKKDVEELNNKEPNYSIQDFGATLNSEYKIEDEIKIGAGLRDQVSPIDRSNYYKTPDYFQSTSTERTVEEKPEETLNKVMGIDPIQSGGVVTSTKGVSYDDYINDIRRRTNRVLKQEKDKRVATKKKEVIYPYIDYNDNDRNYRFKTKSCTVVFTHKDFFSCGVGLFGEIERIYRNYGIEEAQNVMNLIINEFNIIYNKTWGHKYAFGLFSITDRYEELVDYFYSIADSASDFEQNPNSDNRIIIFTLKFK